MEVRIVDVAAKLLAAVSVIKLIEDVQLVRLQANLEEWLDAYSALIAIIFEAATGWISVPGFIVSPLEQNLVVLFALVTSAMVRGALSVPRNSYMRGLSTAEQAVVVAKPSGIVEALLIPVFAILLYASIYTVLYGTFDWVWGSVLSAVAAASFLLRHLVIRNTPIARARRFRAIGHQLVVVGVVAAGLVLANQLLIQLFP